jgi:adenylyl-sulfate kinase
MTTSRNITLSENLVSLAERERRNKHRGGILWFTGLSASGKTTLSIQLERRLFDLGWQVCILDGDNVRHGLSRDLGFSSKDREENIRRIGEVAKLMALSGSIVITAFISPFRTDRDRVRSLAGPLFHEIFIDANLEVCEQRDPKGLYKKARQGLIPEFTGITSPYEFPLQPELRIPTHERSIDESVELLTTYAKSALSLVE